MNLTNKFHTVNHNKLRLIRRLTVDVTTKATEIVGLDIKSQPDPNKSGCLQAQNNYCRNSDRSININKNTSSSDQIKFHMI